MTSLLLLAVSLAIILLPLAAINWKNTHGQAARLAQAWSSARAKQQAMSTSLEDLERRLQDSLRLEKSLLRKIRHLQQQIQALPQDLPEAPALQEIESATQGTIRHLAELMEAQIDPEGRHRLLSHADELSSRHAESHTALACLQDILGTPMSSAQAEPAEQDAHAASSQTDHAQDGGDTEASAQPEQPETMANAALIASAQQAAHRTETRVH